MLRRAPLVVSAVCPGPRRRVLQDRYRVLQAAVRPNMVEHALAMVAVLAVVLDYLPVLPALRGLVSVERHALYSLRHALPTYVERRQCSVLTRRWATQAPVT